MFFSIHQNSVNPGWVLLILLNYWPSITESVSPSKLNQTKTWHTFSKLKRKHYKVNSSAMVQLKLAACSYNRSDLGKPLPRSRSILVPLTALTSSEHLHWVFLLCFSKYHDLLGFVTTWNYLKYKDSRCTIRFLAASARNRPQTQDRGAQSSII